MLSTGDIQRKIRTVRNIQQICRAMRTISSIKLRKAEERILAARPYANALRLMVARLGGGSDFSHPLLEKREIERSCVIAISADKGLAGGFNTNIIREASTLVKSLAPCSAVTIGRKITDAFRRQEIDVDTAISPVGNNPEFRTIAALADHIGDNYTNGVWDRVDLIYSSFTGKIITRQILPIEAPEEDHGHIDFIYAPSPVEILEHLMPRYLRTFIFAALLSSIAAEHAARVASMSLATDNAEDMIHNLTMEYNKSRQAGITRDLIDIVGAAEALR